jgi:hypothetical protein
MPRSRPSPVSCTPGSMAADFHRRPDFGHAGSHPDLPASNIRDREQPDLE